MTELQRRWAAFHQRPFPGLTGAEVPDRVDLVSLDSFAAGCVDSVAGGASLGPDHLAVLGRCREELEAVLPHLGGEARAYFAELAWLVREAL